MGAVTGQGGLGVMTLGELALLVYLLVGFGGSLGVFVYFICQDEEDRDA